MTLGRTSSGALKIKTDGGLRAVECACCRGVCGVKVPQDLRELVAAGNVTMYGLPPDYFDMYEDSWKAEWYPDTSEGFYLADLVYNKSTGYLIRDFYYIEFFKKIDEENYTYGFGSIGLPQNCYDENITTVSGTFTMNGEGEYPYYWFGDMAVPPPNLVFS